MAMATGSGKTITACAVISAYLDRHPKSRVLVLTHNQVILRRNFCANEFLNAFELTKADQLTKARAQRVVIAIPATINEQIKKAGKFDLIVVDEAHEHWAAPRVQRLLKQLKYPKQLLLTASHSGFPKARFKKYLYSVLEGFHDGVLPKVGFSLLAAHLDFDLADYDTNDELLDSIVIEEEQVQDLCDELSQRLLTLGSGSLPKTMIICHSVTMACAVFKALKDHHAAEVDLSVSARNDLEPHLVDPDSSNLDRFRLKKNPRLIVVAQRGVLGFDCADLEVVVDFSGTRNIERTRQHVGRLLRMSPTRKTKTFIKLVPHDMEYYGLYLMGAVVALMHPENDALFEGDPKSIRIATKTSNTVTVRKPSGLNWWRGDSLTVACPVLDPEEYCARLSPRTAGGRILWDVAFTDLEEIEEFERGDMAAKNARLLEYAASDRFRPRPDSDDHEERVLGRHLRRLGLKRSSAMHAAILKRLTYLRPDWFDRLNTPKSLLRSHAAVPSNHIPRSTAAAAEDRRVRRTFDSLTKKSSKRFDAPFRTELMRSRPDWFLSTPSDRLDIVSMVASDSVTETEIRHRIASKLLAFCDPNTDNYDPQTYAAIQRQLPDLLTDPIFIAKLEIYQLAKQGAPRPHHLIPGQRELAKRLLDLTSPGPSYDRAFDASINHLRADWFATKDRHQSNKAIILAMASVPSVRRPCQSSADPEEVRLARALSSYCERSRAAFDHVFATKIRELRPDWFQTEIKRVSLKEQLLIFATTNRSRPAPAATSSQEALLGHALNRLATRQHPSYDEHFHRILVEERPDWFARPHLKEYWKLKWPLSAEDHEWFRRSCLHPKSLWFDKAMALELGSTNTSKPSPLSRVSPPESRTSSLARVRVGIEGDFKHPDTAYLETP